MSGRLPYKTGVEHGSAVGAYSAPEYALALSANFSFIPATLKKAGGSQNVVQFWSISSNFCSGNPKSARSRHRPQMSERWLY
jgi:hypothetical protein